MHADMIANCKHGITDNAQHDTPHGWSIHSNSSRIAELIATRFLKQNVHQVIRLESLTA